MSALEDVTREDVLLTRRGPDKGKHHHKRTPLELDTQKMVDLEGHIPKQGEPVLISKKKNSERSLKRARRGGDKEKRQRDSAKCL